MQSLGRFLAPPGILNIYWLRKGPGKFVMGSWKVRKSRGFFVEP